MVNQNDWGPRRGISFNGLIQELLVALLRQAAPRPAIEYFRVCWSVQSDASGKNQIAAPYVVKVEGRKRPDDQGGKAGPITLPASAQFWQKEAWNLFTCLVVREPRVA